MKKQSYSPKISDYDNPKIKGHLMKNTTYGEIPSAWGVSLLKDVSIKKGGVQTGPFGSQLHQRDYKQVGTPIITVEHLGENRIIHENLPLVSDEDLDRLNRYTLKEGDIVFSRVGSVDRRAFVKKKEEGWLFSGRCLRVRPNPKIVDPSYLSWFFGHPNFIDYIRRIAVGATMPSLNTNLLESVEIILPSIGEQKNIASILDSLNEKIDLNRQMNSTLEQIAQTLFKRWFIDFEFPDENGNPYRSSGGRMVDSELGEIPEGWRVGKLGDIVYEKRKNVKVEDLHPETPYFGLEHMPRKSISLSEWGNANEVSSNKLIFEKNDVLFGKLRPYFHKVGVAPIDGVCSTDIIVISPEEDYYSFVLSIVSSEKFVEYATQTSEGTKMPRANWKTLAKYPIVIPDKLTSKRYNEMVSAFVNIMHKNIFECKNLSQIRDSLLPKLMSGKIRVGC